MWGKRERLGSVGVAKAAADMIPDGRLHVLAGGHAPWLGQPVETAVAVLDFAR